LKLKLRYLQKVISREPVSFRKARTSHANRGTIVNERRRHPRAFTILLGRFSSKQTNLQFQHGMRICSPFIGISLIS